ncbi:TPA: hypothetical protein ACKE1D_002324 [Acinetobacter nosocomialis]
MFFLYRFVFVSLVTLSVLNLMGCRPMSKNEFNTRCVGAGHDLSQCNCIYSSLEQHYSPQFVESLPKVSLQNIDTKMNFVETMNKTMQQCQFSARKQ